MSCPHPGPHCVAQTLLLPVLAHGTHSHTTHAVALCAVITIDVLRRAGAKVTVASVGNSLTVNCSRGVVLVADAMIKDVENENFDLIACPVSMWLMVCLVV